MAAHHGTSSPHARRPQPGAPPGTLLVGPESRASVIRVLAYGPDAVHEQEIDDLQAIGPLLERWPVVWVNVDGLGDEATLQGLGELFGLHRLALEDVTHVPQRPKAEQYGQTLFLVTHMLSLDERLQAEQVSLFLTDRAVITFQERRGDCLDPVRDRIRQGVGRIRAAGSDYLAYALLDTILDHHFPVLEAYGERLAALEEQMTQEANVQVVSRVRQAKHELLMLRRIAWPQRDAVNWLLREETPLIGPETRPYLRDCYDHVTRVIDVLETYRELASDLMAMHLSVISNQMNAVMKTLTVMAAIFIPLTFIAGIYGMNFDKMPELKQPWGYPAALGVMAAVAGGMVLYFWKKKWL
jgi:magnesium transporter